MSHICSTFGLGNNCYSLLHLRLLLKGSDYVHSLRSNFQLQNVDPPEEILADIQLLKDEI